jgi:probable HAF family extracellular repeat protein
MKTRRITIAARTVSGVSTQARRRGVIAVSLAALTATATVVVTGPARAEATASAASAFIDQNGKYTPLGNVNGLTTGHESINDSGQVAGYYTPDGGTARSFIRSANGRYTTFDEAAGVLTVAVRINDKGSVVGYYATTAAHGFLRRPDGTITTVDVPGATQTELAGINDSGAVVGAYADADGQVHGFLLDHGVLTVIDPPGLAGDPAERSTAALDINNQGQVVGQYVDPANVLHGYLWQPGRGFTTIDPPQITSFDSPVAGAGTVAADINDSDHILLPAAGTDFQTRGVPIS